MKSQIIFSVIFTVLCLIVFPVEVAVAVPIGTAFTYQGRLMDANEPADGLYDFQFRLFDDPNAGSQHGDAIDFNDLDVIDGYFTVELDFGSDVFNGDARWLQISVMPGDSMGRMTILSPRQEVTPTPYAMYAKSAGGDGDWTVDGDDMYAIPPGNVGIGTVPTGAGKLQVITSSGTGMHGETSANIGSGVSGIASNTGNVVNYGGYFISEGGQGSGVVGVAKGMYGKGVYGVATNPNDVTNYGGYFLAKGTSGMGVYGEAATSSGTNYGVYGKTNSDDGYAGYFEGGRSYFEGNVGIGIAEPNEKLEVDGPVIATPVAGKWKCDSIESSWGNYQWDSQLINTNTDYLSWSSGTEVITILKEGYYSISAMLTISGLSAGDVTYAQIRHNLDIIARSYRFTNGSIETHQITVIEYFDKNDEVKCYVYGGDRYGSSIPYTVLSIHRLN